MAKLCSKFSDSQINELKSKLKRPTDIAELKKIQSVLMIDRGKKIEEIEWLTGLKRSRIFELRLFYLTKGLKALETRPKKQKYLWILKYQNR